MKLKKFFSPNFQILGPLGCQGWVVIPQNVKKSQNHCTLVDICTYIWVHSCTGGWVDRCTDGGFIAVLAAEWKDVHRVGTAAFWRTFNHEDKISPGW